MVGDAVGDKVGDIVGESVGEGVGAGVPVLAARMAKAKKAPRRRNSANPTTKKTLTLCDVLVRGRFPPPSLVVASPMIAMTGCQGELELYRFEKNKEPLGLGVGPYAIFKAMNSNNSICVFE